YIPTILHARKYVRTYYVNVLRRCRWGGRVFNADAGAPIAFPESLWADQARGTNRWSARWVKPQICLIIIIKPVSLSAQHAQYCNVATCRSKSLRLGIVPNLW